MIKIIIFLLIIILLILLLVYIFKYKIEKFTDINWSFPVEQNNDFDTYNAKNVLETTNFRAQCPVGNLTVTNALYGNGRRNMNITDNLNNACGAGTQNYCDVTINNQLAGYDPAPKVKKSGLNIQYICHHYNFNENPINPGNFEINNDSLLDTYTYPNVIETGFFRAACPIGNINVVNAKYGIDNNRNIDIKNQLDSACGNGTKNSCDVTINNQLAGFDPFRKVKKSALNIQYTCPRMNNHVIDYKSPDNQKTLFSASCPNGLLNINSAMYGDENKKCFTDVKDILQKKCGDGLKQSCQIVLDDKTVGKNPCKNSPNNLYNVKYTCKDYPISTILNTKINNTASITCPFDKKIVIQNATFSNYSTLKNALDVTDFIKSKADGNQNYSVKVTPQNLGLIKTTLINPGTRYARYETNTISDDYNVLSINYNCL